MVYFVDIMDDSVNCDLSNFISFNNDCWPYNFESERVRSWFQAQVLVHNNEFFCSIFYPLCILSSSNCVHYFNCAVFQ